MPFKSLIQAWQIPFDQGELILVYVGSVLILLARPSTCKQAIQPLLKASLKNVYVYEYAFFLSLTWAYLPQGRKLF